VRAKDKEFLAKRHEVETFQVRDSVNRIEPTPETRHFPGNFFQVIAVSTDQRYLHLPVWTSIIIDA
jgi:hypothetical protein